MKIIHSSPIFDNPVTQLKSRQSTFPFLCEFKDGTIGATVVIGEALESVDGATYFLTSNDKGRTWSKPVKMHDTTGYEFPLTDYCKATVLPDGTVVCFGYAYVRKDPELPVCNPENGGSLESLVFCSYSKDNGKTWSKFNLIDSPWLSTEASAPIVCLKDGTLITPIAPFTNWDGTLHSKLCGRAARSTDGGKTWNCDSICMDFGDELITCFEQRMCQLESGVIICISWNEHVETGKRYENHYTVSYDNGLTWSKPISTGIMGQASSVCSLGGEKFLSLHAIRRDTNRPGILACVVDFSEKTYNIVEKELIWEPKTAIVKSNKMAEIFSCLKFGQPGAICLKDGNVLMSHWEVEEGQYSTVCTLIEM